MKKVNQIFASFFMIMGVITATAAIYGATHQWAMAIMCIVMTLILASEKPTKTQKR